MKNLRNFFPFLKEKKEIIYLDISGTALKPDSVIKSINDYYQKYSINSHSIINNSLFNTLTKIIYQTRKLVAERIKVFLPEEIIFFPSATYAFNILALSCEDYLKKGDNILLTYLEHSSNIFPWQAVAKKKKVFIKYLPLTTEFTIDINQINKLVDYRTKIVSFFHVSNSLGTINQVAEIAQKIKKINPNCRIILDACQSIVNIPIEAKKWNLDALIFSAHKAYGPTGLGILWLKKDFGENLPDLLWGGGKLNFPNLDEKISILEKKHFLPQKFEVGSLPLAQIFGLKASLEFLNMLGQENIRQHDTNLRKCTFQKLREVKNLIIYNPIKEQDLVTTNIITFNLLGYHAHDVADYLGKQNIYLRSGNFCNPYLSKLIGINSALRISFGVYNNQLDIDKLKFHLEKIIQNPEIIIDIL